MPHWIGVGDKPIFQCQHTLGSTTQGHGAINKQKCPEQCEAYHNKIGQNDNVVKNCSPLNAMLKLDI